MRLHVSALAALLSTTALITIAPDAEAQDSEEIIVTATRRAESIQDVPIAVTAILPEDLEKQGVVNIQNLTSVAPSFSTSQAQTSSGTVVLRIRGVGTTSNNIGFESAVGVFIDGAYQSRPGIALGEFVDVERLEVLRGPQGTLFGRNTSAGALNVINKRPDLEEFGGFVNATLGNFDQRSVQGAINVPLAEGKLAARLTGAWRERDGFIDLVGPNGEDLGDSDDANQFYIRGQLGFEEDNGVKGRIVVDYAESNAVCCAAVEIQRSGVEVAGLFNAVGLGARGGNSAELFNDDPLDNSAAEDIVNERVANVNFQPNPENNQIGVVAEVEVPIGDFADLIYIGSYRDYQATENYDSDFSGLSVFDVELSDTDIETVTQELRLQGDAWDDRLSWLVGGFYSDEVIEAEQNFSLGPDFNPLVDALLLGGTQGAFPSGPLIAGGGALAAFSGGANSDVVFADNFFTQESSSWSIFTHNTFDITEQLSLTAGIRYTDESKDGTFTQPNGNNPLCEGVLNNIDTGALFTGGGLVIDSGIPGVITAGPLAALAPTILGTGCFAFTAPADQPLAAALPLPTTFDDEFDDDELIWTVKAAYDVTDDINAYAGFTHGFKTGGFNLDSTAAIPVGGVSDPTFESEEVDAFEIGIKSKLLDGRVTLNVAGFFEDFSNFQVLEFTGAQFVTFNVPSAESLGVEIEATAQATDNLLLNGGLTVLDASYPDDCAGDLTAVNVVALCGNDLTNAPGTVGLLGGTYTGDLTSNLNFFLNGQLRFESDRRTSTQAIVLPDQADVDAAIAAGTLDALLDGATPNPLDIQESTVKLNLRAGVGSEEAGWGLEVWATNLTDQVTRGVTFNTPLRGGRSAFVQEPRTFGVTARTDF